MTTTNLKAEVLRVVSGRVRVDDTLTLPELFAAVCASCPTTLETFKATVVELFEDRQIRLEDYTRAWADIWSRPEAIRHNLDERGGYGLKWYVRGVA